MNKEDDGYIIMNKEEDGDLMKNKEDGDVIMNKEESDAIISWHELLSLQLRKMSEGCLIKEEDFRLTMFDQRGRSFD